MSENNKNKNEVTEVGDGVAAIGLTKEKLMKIEAVSNKYLFEKLNVEGELQKAVLISQGIRQLREIVTDEVMAPIMHLMGSRLGFVTDKDEKPEKYTIAQVKEVVIEGLLNGVFPYNNQFNIITAKLYIAKNGYTYKISKLQGITDFKWNHFLLNKTDGGHHWVGFKGAWKKDGIANSLDGEIPVKKYSTDGPDVVMGKAERKLKYRCYCAMTETDVTENEEMDAAEFVEGNKQLETSSLQNRAAEITGGDK